MAVAVAVDHKSVPFTSRMRLALRLSFHAATTFRCFSASGFTRPACAPGHSVGLGLWH